MSSQLLSPGPETAVSLTPCVIPAHAESSISFQAALPEFVKSRGAGSKRFGPVIFLVVVTTEVFRARA
jgi:hypothetical protein